MKKNLVQDVVPPKKSIRDIELPRNREVIDVTKKTPKYSPKEDPFARPVSINQSPVKIETSNVVDKNPPPPSTPTSSYKYDYPKPKKSRKLLYFGILVVFVGIFFAVSTMFKSAEIKVTPKQDTKTLNEVFTAKKDSPSGLAFQIVNISKEVEKVVDPKDITSEQKVEKKARGTIVIYNNFGSAPQKLIATTRFQTPEGLIYRLVSAVTIPGKITKDGKSIPGSIEAIVEADKAGSEYNVGLKDFTIPGLKTDPAKYKDIYAKSKTEMSGGFSGMQKVITKAVLEKSEAEMEGSLRDTLSNDITSQIPDNFVLYKKSMSFKFDPAISATNSNGTVVLKKKGTTNAIIFDKSILTKSILDKVFPDAGSNVIKIVNLDSLDFSYNASTTPQNASTSITFNLKGDAILEWVFDEAKLKNDLLGLSKKGANTVLSSYSAIKEAWVTTKPFWNTTIPKDPKKVEVINTVNN